MKRQLFVITGTSRGLGFCLAEQLLIPQNHLLCLSRHASAELAQIASQRGAPLTQLVWCCILE
jgi:short-subunit dehydrogenase